MSMLGCILRNMYWANDFVRRSPVRKHYKDIEVVLNNRNDIGLAMQDRHLRRMLRYAVAHAGFYSKYDPDDLRHFPVINKTIIQDHYGLFKADPAVIPEHAGAMHIQRTSGSTGTPFEVPQDARKRNRRVAELKYFGQIAGFKSHEKLIQLRAWNSWQNKSKTQSRKENIIPFNISNMNDQRLAELARSIIKNKATALRGYASSIDLFVQYVASHGIKLPCLKLIIAGSESLMDSTRAQIEIHIGCKVISQYANEENGILAQESVAASGTEKVFYLNHASYYFEIFKMDQDAPAPFGELGRIVVTDLFNYALPMIRYDTGDTGIMLPCDGNSNGFPVLSRLYGRRLDMIYDVLGNPVHPMAIGRTLKHYPDIRQWQFIQKSRNEYVLRLKLTDAAKKNDCAERLIPLLGGDGARMQVELVDEIAVLASGKRKPVVNEWVK